MNEQNNKELNNEAMEAVDETKEQAAENKEADEKKSGNKKGFGEKVKGAVVGAWNSPVGRNFRKGAKIVGAVTIFSLAVLGGVGLATSRRGDNGSGDPSSDGMMNDIGCETDEDMFEAPTEEDICSSEQEETEGTDKA